MPRSYQPGRLCSIPDCGRKHQAKGLCRKHYNQKHYDAKPYWNTPDGRARRLLACAKDNSRRRGHPQPTLTVADLLPALKAGVCQVSGLPFDFSGGKGAMHPLTPSLDRPDSSKPYTRDNFRVVCWAVNAGCGAWGLETAKRVWAAVLSTPPNSH